MSGDDASHTDHLGRMVNIEKLPLNCAGGTVDIAGNDVDNLREHTADGPLTYRVSPRHHYMDQYRDIKKPNTQHRYIAWKVCVRCS